MAEENIQDLDLEKVNNFLRESTERYAKEYFDSRAAELQPQSTPTKPALSQEEQARENLKTIINPFIQPGLNALQTEVLDVKDSSQFYSNFDGSTEEKAEIESMFNTLKSQGRPIPRQDIRDYLEGKLAREKPADYEKRTSERRKRQTEGLNSAVDFGIGSIDRAKNDTRYTKEALWSMPMDELEKLMDGITF